MAEGTERMTAEITAALEGLVRQAKSAHPAWPVSEEALCMHVLSVVRGEPAELATAIARAHGADLLLALACMRGVPAAIERFHSDVLVPASARLDEDARQALFIALVYGKDGPPKLASYSGTAPLLHWARVVASHRLVDLRSAPRREVELDEELAGRAMLAIPTVERAVVTSEHRELFRTALRIALASLPQGDYALLHLHWQRGLSYRQMGAIMGLSHAGIGYRLERIHARVADELRAVLRRSGSGAAELSSLLRSVLSQMDGSLPPLDDAPRRAIA